MNTENSSEGRKTVKRAMGLEPTENVRIFGGKPHVFDPGPAFGTVGRPPLVVDLEFLEVCYCWSSVPESIKAAILAMIRSAEGRTGPLNPSVFATSGPDALENVLDGSPVACGTIERIRCNGEDSDLGG